MDDKTVAIDPLPESKHRKNRVRGFLKNSILKLSILMFWLWQLAFVSVAAFLLIPDVLPIIWQQYRYDGMPLHYFLLTIILLLIPIACVLVIGYMLTSSDEFTSTEGPDYRPVLKLFYGFEIPALLLLTLFLINLRDFDVALYWLFFTAAVAMGFWLILVGYEWAKSPKVDLVVRAKNPLMMLGSTIAFSMGAYVSVALALFVIPPVFLFITEVIPSITSSILEFDWSFKIRNLSLGILWDIFLALIIMAFVSLSLALVAVMPLFLAYLYLGQYFRRIKHTTGWLHVLSILVLAGLVVLHLNLGNQTQQEVMASLENETPTDSEKQELLQQSEKIRQGLLNAYLSRYRYFSSTETSNLLSVFYEDTFPISKKLADYPQRLANLMLKPLLYEGNNIQDTPKAAALYERFFDAPIQKAEIDEIWKTLDYNMEGTAQNAAGLLDVNQNSVYLKSQTIDVSVKDQLATINVSQELVNMHKRRREAVVHFSLPEFSVITGVWLSDSKNNLQKDRFLVSPRGAAQSVYKREVARAIDPALLEKVGPDLYRLRIFPILPARVRIWNEEEIAGDPIYVTFEYQTLADSNGHWPMPKVMEKRQIFWNKNTQDIINGEPVERTATGSWVPEKVSHVNNVTPSIIELSNQLGLKQTAVPKSMAKDNEVFSTNIDATTIKELVKTSTVLIDGSRSMYQNKEELIRVLKSLDGASIYFCDLNCTVTSLAESDNWIFWGNTKPIQQLEAFANQNKQGNNNKILMLTDEGSYEAEDDLQEIVDPGQPVWVLHLGNSRPYAYADAWLSSIVRSGGGFSYSGIESLLNDIAIIDNLQRKRVDNEDISSTGEPQTIRLAGDWLWVTVNENPPVQSPEKTGSVYAKLASAIDISNATHLGKTPPLSELDVLHKKAAQAGIVTNLSSMIVLVNAEQKAALAEAERADDRFARETETGNQTVSVPRDTLSVPAVPEPEEWALLLITLILIGYSLMKKYREKLELAGIPFFGPKTAAM